jgi:uncharacterized protein (DUF427 family)
VALDSVAVMRPQRDEPGPGQESVWDYPRPPAVRAIDAHVRIVHNGITLVDTRQAIQILETSQAPGYYFSRADIALEHLTQSRHTSYCEWKGQATYWAVLATTTPSVADVAWSYDNPTPAYAAITGYLAFYPQKVDECWVNDYRVVPNPGDFYGGWITPDVVGPFKGAPGTRMW